MPTEVAKVVVNASPAIVVPGACLATMQPFPFSAVLVYHSAAPMDHDPPLIAPRAGPAGA